MPSTAGSLGLTKAASSSGAAFRRLPNAEGRQEPQVELLSG